MWVGASDQAKEGEWYWIDGSRFEENHSRWKDTLLDNFGTDDEDCLLMGFRMNEKYWGLWDQPCQNLQYFTCQYT